MFSGAPDRTRTCNRRLRRPMLYPVELQARTPLAELAVGRGRGIRTPDFCVPNATLYQTELYPERARDSLHQRSPGMPRMTTYGHQTADTDRDTLPTIPRHRQTACSVDARTKRERRALLYKNGAPGEIRTPDHLVRSQVLYPTELRAHTEPTAPGRFPEPPKRGAELFRVASRRSTPLMKIFQHALLMSHPRHVLPHEASGSKDRPPATGNDEGNGCNRSLR